MKNPSLFALLTFAALMLGGCAVYTRGTVVAPAPAYPGYVLTYADGSCWADDVWYPRCPWYPGATFGYYVYWHHRYVHRPHYHWRHYHAPPPPHWRHHRPHPPPPRGRRF